MKYHVICDIKKKGEKNDVYVHVTRHRKPYVQITCQKKDPDVHFICYRIGNSYVQIICYKIEKILTCTFTLLAKNRKLYVQITHHEKDPDMYIHIARHRIENRMFKSSAIK